MFKKIDKVTGMRSIHKLLYISMPKYWQAKTTIKANTVPNAAEPAAK
jgi:hypothetical protein